MAGTPPGESGRPVRIEAPGAVLAGRLFEPASEASSAVVLHGATGIPQRFYRAFAAWLAEARGAAVLTYDYRDFGASAPEPAATRRSGATMADWGCRDQAAALDWAIAAHPGRPVDVVGHSLGGLMLPFHESAGAVRSAVVVASGPAYWRRHPPHFAPVVLAFWFGHVPAMVAAFGHLPGRLSGFGQDLPAGVYWQWRRWCVSPDFYEGDYGRALPLPRPERVRAAMTFLALSDDAMMPPERVAALQRYYPHARRRFEVLRPADAGLRRIGHLGAFSRHTRALWPRLAAGLGATARSAPSEPA